MADISRITILTRKYVDRSISPVEQVELDLWLNASPGNKMQFEERIKEENLLNGLAILQEGEEAAQANYGRINFAVPANQTGHTVPIRSTRWRFYAAAAAVLLLAATGVIFLLNKKGAPGVQQGIAVHKNDAPPGGDKAILTLADNSTIILDSAGNGSLGQQGNSRVVKLGDGLLAYELVSQAGSAVNYNTITTPVGGRYQVTLPDGTKVWLNARSSLRFPTAFTGGQRLVELAGEAYFEVSKNPLKPFRVQVGNMQVSVLGTHFNIMAYQDEKQVRTTLLEGSVRVSNGAETVMLHPGEQAQLGHGLKVIKGVDTEEVTAWKNGYFQFQSADIETVMRSLARWYDVDVKYEGAHSGNRLTAMIKRDSYASDVLEILSASGYHFRIEGTARKTITVLP